MNLVSATTSCDADVTLLNQDPYPAIPGEYVKVVFKITGLENANCGDVSFELLENYPFTLDPDTPANVTIKSGTYTSDYSSYTLIPYKIRVDETALNEEYEIKIKYSTDYFTSIYIKKFNITLDDLRSDFEISIKEYDKSTNNLILQIINTGNQDVQALTLEIQKQDTIDVKGSKVYIVGDLDSNEDTTASFEAIPSQGDIKIKIKYTDSLNERRTIEQSIAFEPSYFENRIKDMKPTPWGSYIFLLIIIVLIAIWLIRRNRKKKDKEKLLKMK